MEVGFPAYRYHATEPRRIVLSGAEEAALGEGWFDSPKKTAPDAEPEPKPKRRGRLSTLVGGGAE